MPLPQIGSCAHNVSDSLFQSGATLLKPCDAPLVLDKEDEFWGAAPDTKGMEDSDPTDACSLELWLRCHGSPCPSPIVACTLRLEGPHNRSGREAWPAIALRASRVASADQYSHTHTHTHKHTHTHTFFYALPLMHLSPHGVFLTPWCIPNPMTALETHSPEVSCTHCRKYPSR